MNRQSAQSWLNQWIRAATWSILEAAHLVNNSEPPLSEAKKPSTVSPSPVAQVYWWLIKESRKGKLWPLEGEDDNARFSPGTLMRHIREVGAGKFEIHPRIWKAYNSKGKAKPGPSVDNALARHFYISAANFVWAESPKATISAVASLLADLHKAIEARVGTCPFRWKSHSTIRRYLKGHSGEPKGGRPKKSIFLPLPSLNAITDKLITHKLI